MQMDVRVYLPELGRFISVDPVDGGTDNSYVYATDPVNESDLSGMIVETVADIAGIGYDSYELWNHPSLGNASMLGWSVVAAFIPIVPGSYVGRAGAAAIKETKATGKVTPLKKAPKAISKPPVSKAPLKKPPKAGGSKIFNSKRGGVSSKQFGNSRHGSRMGKLNNKANSWRIGWSHVGSKSSGAAVFRIRTPVAKFNLFGKSFKLGGHIDLFKGPRLW